MKTATLVEDQIGGHIAEKRGVARLYKLSEPKDFDGDGVAHDHVIVRIIWPHRNLAGCVQVFPATEHGDIAEPFLKERVGSFQLDGNPKGDDAYIEGCFAWALASCGYPIT